MSVSLGTGLSITLIAVVAALVGGIVAIFYSPGPYGRSCVQHFAAGIVFAAVAAKLLPDLHAEAPIWVITGFAVGIVTMLGVHQVSRIVEHAGAGGGFAGAASLLVTVGINMLIDGVLIGVAFLADVRTGFIITVALAFETLFVSLAGVTALGDGAAVYEKLAVPGAFGALLLVGVTSGMLLFGGATNAVITVVLAFGAANLIYLVTEELLVKAGEVPQTPVSTLLFFVGFLLIFVFDMVF